MIITISGTPGTGKTAAAKELSKLLGYEVISLTELVEKGKIRSGYDKKRKSRIVDEEKLDNSVKKLIDKKKNYIIEGGPSHFISSDFCVILRANPDLLMRRMKKRKWPAGKIKENIQAEILDAAVIEAIERNKKTLEIDTSRRTPKQTAALIKKLLNNHHLQKTYIAGKVDWTEKYEKYLLE